MSNLSWLTRVFQEFEKPLPFRHNLVRMPKPFLKSFRKFLDVPEGYSIW